jgi:LysM repeat protein
VLAADCETVTVQTGDTLSLLACRYRTTIPVLQGMNDLVASTVITAGERLHVPVPTGGPAVCS